MSENSSVKSPEKAIDTIIQKYNNNEPLAISEIALLIVISSLIIIRIYNQLRKYHIPLPRIPFFKRIKSVKLEEVLYELLGLTNAHRVVVVTFSSETSENSQSIHEIRVEYEALSPSASSIKNTFRGTELSRVIEHLLKEEHASFKRYCITDLTIPEHTRKNLDTLGLTTIFRRVLVNRLGSAYGILEIHFTGTPTDILSDEVLNSETYLKDNIERIFNKFSGIHDNPN